ncbi:hypothetical protein PIB30_024062 [Stylosanthes scabra]|uniref:BHLH domain-containing protein n=1 Tax=Stylosanthes scabra TaxID=79078 RepID=A0ABU6S964_9FABA|nr:hypothetical protein [Stylosanthes scabra]
MNNHRVPDLEIEMEEQEYHTRQKKPSSISMAADEDVMELLWQNGQVVMHTQNHRPTPTTNQNHHLFMQEDEMISLLNPPFDHTLSSDFLYDNHTTTTSADMHTTPPHTSSITDLRPFPAPRPPIPPPRRQDKEPPATNTPNFACFAKHNNARGDAVATKKPIAPREQTTVVESCDTPFAETSRVSENARCSEGDGRRGSMSGAGEAAPSTTALDLTMTSSPGGSCSSGELFQRAAAEDRKRKGREAEDWECQSEDVDFESAEAKKQGRGGSTSTRRSRAAEVHNLSERRRRDRINEKMKALQDLIPRSNKSDKASMLDEAIEYLKSLQLQVQMMSMGCGMVPTMMFPGIQHQYMPAMGMGIGMGMGMDMGMGMNMNMNMNMNRPVMPFPNMLAASPAAATHLGPRFPMPPFPVPHHVPSAPNTRMQQLQAANNNQSDNNSNMMPNNSVVTPLADPNHHSRIPPIFTDPYQQYLAHGPHQMQFQLMQNQAVNQPNVCKPSTSGGPETHHQPEKGRGSRPLLTVTCIVCIAG